MDLSSQRTRYSSRGASSAKYLYPLRILRTKGPSFPARILRGGHFTTFGRAINRRTWSDLCIDIGALKYTNVPLIGLSPPVRIYYKSGTSRGTQITVDRHSF